MCLSMSSAKKQRLKTCFSWKGEGWFSFRCIAVRRPGTMERGTMILSWWDFQGFPISLMMMRPSLARTASWRYLFVSVDLLHFLEGDVPQVRCSFTFARLVQDAWISLHADLLVNIAELIPEESSSCSLKTTASSMALLKLQIWHLGLVQSGAFLLA